MILQALKNMYPKVSEKVLRAVIKDLEKCETTEKVVTNSPVKWQFVEILSQKIIF